MIDLHFHLLPGLDDGPATMQDSIALARAAREAGTRTIVATPHLDYTWMVEPEAIVPGVDDLRQALAAEGVDVELAAGAEIALSRAVDLDDAQLEPLKLGRHLLVESPLSHAGGDLEAQLFGLRVRGHEILLAHPERCPTFHRDPELLRRLVDGGALCSVTASALTGQFGGTVRRFAAEMLSENLVHSLDSDAHDLRRRRPEVLPQIEQASRDLAGLSGLAPWLTGDAPAAILAGERLPARPSAVAPKRRRWLRRA